MVKIPLEDQQYLPASGTFVIGHDLHNHFLTGCEYIPSRRRIRQQNRFEFVENCSWRIQINEALQTGLLHS
jgi:hypothetical protein